jgi:hypothetical protein
MLYFWKTNEKAMKKNQEVPNWFEGEIYPEGDIVRNPFSGVEFQLNNVELTIYDLLMGSQMLAESVTDNTVRENLYQNVRKCASWFEENNIKAYMALID